MTVILAYIALFIRGKCPGGNVRGGGIVRIPNHTCTYPKRLYGRANKMAGPTIAAHA